MDDIFELVISFLSLVFGVYVISLVATLLPVNILGLNFGYLFLGVFIVIAIFWFLKEVAGI